MVCNKNKIFLSRKNPKQSECSFKEILALFGLKHFLSILAGIYEDSSISVFSVYSLSLVSLTQFILFFCLVSLTQFILFFGDAAIQCVFKSASVPEN